MKRKINSPQLLKSLLLVGVLAGPLAFNAMAATRVDIQWSPLDTWTDDTGTNTYAAWDDPNNWQGGVVPVVDDTNPAVTQPAFYNAAYNSPVICVVSNNTQVTPVGQLMCGFGGAGTLVVSNGAHFQAGFSGFGDSWTGIGYVSGPGTLIIDAGSDVTLAGHLWVGQGSAAQTGTVIVNGGTLHVPGGELGVGWNGGTNYIYVTNGASVYLRDWAPNTLGAPGNTSAGAFGIMDIGANSQVVITNNATSMMNAVITNHQLIAFEGNGTIQAIYNPGNNTTVLTALAPPGPTTPVFSVQPTNVIVTLGGTATFTAAASPANSYQWMFNSAPLTNGNGISGATTATLTIANFKATETGVYSVVATNSAASPSDRPYTSSQTATATGESFNLYPVITINGINGSTYVSQYATSASGPYTSFSTNIAGTGPVNVIDTTSPLSMAKFYRVLQP